MIALTSDNFEQVTATNQPVLIDFWAAWCGPCKMIAPIIDAVSQKLDGRAVVAKVNVDEQSALSQRFSIMSIPTLVVLKNGKEVDRRVGLMQQDAIISLLQAHM